MPNYKTILFYKYADIKDPYELMEQQRQLCQLLDLKGRTIIAKEGINATLEGREEDIQKYIDTLLNHDDFADINIKISDSYGDSFPKLSIKVRDEIVSLQLGKEDINPNEVTGKYLKAEDLHEWIHTGKEFYMVDMRNDYEFKSGYFEGAILPSLTHFRDLPKVIKELEHLKDKTLVTYCTGGVRCEKASGYLITKGFKDVYQLKDGIHTYMEKYPNQDFVGKLYVFDGRITIGINVDSAEHKVVGKCDLCGAKSDIYANCKYPRCNKHIIACEGCRDQDGKAYCSNECRTKDGVV